ncbi:MAG: hypothetical protein EZS28_019460 [Streblomastix strix]|uniref:Uncharacterized protein n=1 Tax=Streblomastix strix TaxID=222440 RepID=A0A5J4VR38_9EUKA|nr:MAG: hypothetical protein EZS28_019460 [Streblomastix strix]
MIILDDINNSQMYQRTSCSKVLTNQIRPDDDSYKQSTGGVFEWLQVIRANNMASEILDKKMRVKVHQIDVQEGFYEIKLENFPVTFLRMQLEMTEAAKTDMIMGIRDVVMNELLIMNYTLRINIGDTQMLLKVRIAQKDVKEISKTGGMQRYCKGVNRRR